MQTFSNMEDEQSLNAAKGYVLSKAHARWITVVSILVTLVSITSAGISIGIAVHFNAEIQDVKSAISNANHPTSHQQIHGSKQSSHGHQQSNSSEIELWNTSSHPLENASVNPMETGTESSLPGGASTSPLPLAVEDTLNGTYGTSYIRWGRKTCPKSSTRIYEGFVVGQLYTHTGGASDRLCVPFDPEWSNYTDAREPRTLIYGTEYQLGSDSMPDIFAEDHNDKNVPCATCFSTGRVTTLMIPAKRSCPDETWTKEYEGYLMTEYFRHNSSAPYLCVDAEPEFIEGLHGNQNGALFFFVQTDCETTGQCPPYIPNAELTCVVCTK